MNKELLEELADLRIKEKEAKDRIKEILPIIYKEADGIEKGTVLTLKSGKGEFSVTYLRDWTYPEHVIQLEDKYKEEKKKSEQLGTAVYTESISLKFKSNKDE